MTTQSITSGQRRRIVGFVSDAVERVLDELNLSKDGAQCVIEKNGDEFCETARNDTRAAIQKFSVSNRFANEEVCSVYAYPNGYKEKGIAEQSNILRQLLSGIGDADEKLADQPLLTNAEGCSAIPRWEKLAPTYGEAVQKVLDLLKSTRDGKFYNYRDGQTGPKYLRQHAKTAKMFEKLGDEQKGHDILVVQAQFGLRHRGRSARRAREVMDAIEFGLGTFAVGCMLLTHPEREVQWEQLHIDCAGDEFAPEADGVFSHAPVFYFGGGELGFRAYGCGGASEGYGSASAFSAQ